LSIEGVRIMMYKLPELIEKYPFLPEIFEINHITATTPLRVRVDKYKEYVSKRIPYIKSNRALYGNYTGFDLFYVIDSNGNITQVKNKYEHENGTEGGERVGDCVNRIEKPCCVVEIDYVLDEETHSILTDKTVSIYEI